MKFIWTFFKRTCLQISKNQTLFTYELFGIKWQFLQERLISQLKLSDPSPYESYFEIKPTLYIKADFKDFFISKYANFIAEELEWLAQEISDYLDVPIERV